MSPFFLLIKEEPREALFVFVLMYNEKEIFKFRSTLKMQYYNTIHYTYVNVNNNIPKLIYIYIP